MIVRPTERILSALASLEGNKDFEVVLDWLKQSREDLVISGMYSDKETLTRWSQGAYQALDSLIQTAEKARTTLRK